eukprot:103166-Chlamydomonas_euryale.AAC.1
MERAREGRGKEEGTPTLRVWNPHSDHAETYKGGTHTLTMQDRTRVVPTPWPCRTGQVWNPHTGQAGPDRCGTHTLAKQASTAAADVVELPSQSAEWFIMLSGPSHWSGPPGPHRVLGPGAIPVS